VYVSGMVQIDESLLRTQAFVAGEFMPAAAGASFPVLDPASGELLAEVARCGEAEAQAAVDAAAQAQPGFASWTAKRRSDVLRRLYELMLEHREDLAVLMVREEGKPLAEARGEIAYAASFVQWFSEEARRVYGEIIQAHREDSRISVLRQPIGVGAAFTPWNFPCAMITRKVAPALAVGCAVVVKPAEATPLSALALAELGRRAGLPAGVLNVVPTDREGAAEVGAVFTGSSRVRALSFTGSTAVGRKLYGDCAATLKKVSLELGGNAPFLVFDDADLDSAVRGAMVAKFRNAGQTCIAANRILVQRGVHDEFRDRLAARIDELMVASGLEVGAQVGPLIDARGIAKVEAHVEDAMEGGARVVLGGGRHARGAGFFQPTLIEGVAEDALLNREETFGPVAALASFDTEEEGLRLANDTTAGLAAYFYARDVGRVHRVAEALEYGMVGANSGTISTSEAPFGGIKQSGLGREGGRAGIDEWTELKYVCLGDV